MRAAGQVRLYELAWYLHVKTIAQHVSDPGDTLYVVAATLTTNRKAGSARDALADVCQQVARDREIVLCVWDAASSWGVQVADYGLWAVQRQLEGHGCPTYATAAIRPTLRSSFRPWGTLPK